ncbi:hypothetical protein [Litoribacillus peritrichatus]|uniref:Uncharacterized protein n=1 Tax=Litoribacillus peritrichatus TaxID=718191 RepID=A0ABP7MRS0_9GAMM
MIKASFTGELNVLLDQKNISIEEKRRIVATNLALGLISTAISKEGTDHKLADEMKNLPGYVDTIYQSLSR